MHGAPNMGQFIDIDKNIVRDIFYRVSNTDVYNCVTVLSNQPNFMSAINDDLFFYRKFANATHGNSWQYYFPNYPKLCGSFDANDRTYKKCIVADDTLFHDIAILWRFYQNNNEFMEEECRNILDYNPVNLGLAEFDRFLYEIDSLNIADRFADSEMNFRLLSTVELLDGLIERHNFGVDWRTISEHLPRCDHIKLGPNLSKFVRKYKNHLDWTVFNLYPFIDSKFVESNVQLWPAFDWNSIITKVELNEDLLARLMSTVIARYHWYHCWINPAYIALYQELSEPFIEKWFIDTCADNPTNWVNILKRQVLSDEFRITHNKRKN